MVLGIFQRWFVRTGLTLLLCGSVADSAWGQYPGGDRGSRGDRGRGGFSMNPDDRFNEYSGGRDSFNVNQLSPEQRSRFDRTARFLQIQPGPDGTVTRDMYRRSAEQATQRFSQMRGGGGPPGGPPGGFGGPPGGPPPGGFGGPPGAPPPGGFGGPPPGGFGGPPGAPPGAPPAAMEMTDDAAYAWMRRYDSDGDRRLSREEASKSDRIRDSFDQHDGNRDGYIDLGEYKLMFAAMMQSRGGDRDRDRDRDRGGDPRQGGGPPYSGGDYNRDRNDPRQEEVEQRPVVYRYGKLPKDLPSWFTSLDEDKDGQVGMHEWRADSRGMSEFVEMDLNGDGLVTAQEYLRYKQLKEQAVALEARMNGETPPSAFGNRDGGSSRGGSSSGGRSYGYSSSGSSRGRDSRDSNSSRDNRPQDQPGERRPGRNPFGGR